MDELEDFMKAYFYSREESLIPTEPSEPPPEEVSPSPYIAELLNRSESPKGPFYNMYKSNDNLTGYYPESSTLSYNSTSIRSKPESTHAKYEAACHLNEPENIQNSEQLTQMCKYSLYDDYPVLLHSSIEAPWWSLSSTESFLSEDEILNQSFPATDSLYGGFITETSLLDPIDAYTYYCEDSSSVPHYLLQKEVQRANLYDPLSVKSSSLGHKTHDFFGDATQLDVNAVFHYVEKKTPYLEKQSFSKDSDQHPILTKNNDYSTQFSICSDYLSGAMETPHSSPVLTSSLVNLFTSFFEETISTFLPPILDASMELASSYLKDLESTAGARSTLTSKLDISEPSKKKETSLDNAPDYDVSEPIPGYLDELKSRTHSPNKRVLKVTGQLPSPPPDLASLLQKRIYSTRSQSLLTDYYKSGDDWMDLEHEHLKDRLDVMYALHRSMLFCKQQSIDDFEVLEMTP